FVILSGSNQSSFSKYVQRLFDLGNDVHLLPIKPGFLRIILFVVTGKMFVGHLLTKIQHCIEGFTAVITVAREHTKLLDLQPFIQHKSQITAVKDQRTHQEASFFIARVSMDNVYITSVFASG